MSDVIENEAVTETSVLLSPKEELERIKQEFLGLKKELGEVTYQLVSLYDRWVVEHQLVARREAEMNRAMEAFTKQMEALDTKVQKNIQTTASQAMVMVGDIVGKKTKEYFAQEIGGLTQRLENTIERAERFIPDYEKVKASTALKTVVIAMLISLLMGCAIGAWWVASNTISVDKFYKKTGRK